MKKFEVLTDIYFGENALARLSELTYEKVFIVSDPFVVESGLIRHIVKPLEKSKIAYEIFTDVIPDPPLPKVINGVKAFIASGTHCIITVGGGSALDLAKAVRRMAKEVQPDLEAELIAIPTTSGTGSEVTSFAVITDPETNSKIPLVAPDLTPDEAILDEVLVRSVPAGVTAETGMDVMTHAIEAYVSLERNEFSAALAEKAIEICGQYLYRSYADATDTHARRKMHVASCLAGLAFNASNLGLNHGMAHQLGGHFHIPHGRANAILLPVVIEYNSGATAASRNAQLRDPCVEKYCNVAKQLGLSGINQVMTIHSLCNYLRFMAADMGIPMRLSEILDISKEEYESHLDDMATAALDDGCTSTNPRVPTKADVVALYKKIW